MISGVNVGGEEKRNNILTIISPDRRRRAGPGVDVHYTLRLMKDAIFLGSVGRSLLAGLLLFCYFVILRLQVRISVIPAKLAPPPRFIFLFLSSRSFPPALGRHGAVLRCSSVFRTDWCTFVVVPH